MAWAGDGGSKQAPSGTKNIQMFKAATNLWYSVTSISIFFKHSHTIANPFFTCTDAPCGRGVHWSNVPNASKCIHMRLLWPRIEKQSGSPACQAISLYSEYAARRADNFQASLAVQSNWTLLNMIEHDLTHWQDMARSFCCTDHVLCQPGAWRHLPYLRGHQLNLTISHHFTPFHTISHHFTLSPSLSIWLYYMYMIICICRLTRMRRHFLSNQAQHIIYYTLYIRTLMGIIWWNSSNGF